MKNGISMNDMGSSGIEKGYGTQEKYDMWVFPPFWFKSKDETLVFLIDVAWSCFKHF